MNFQDKIKTPALTGSFYFGSISLLAWVELL